MEANPKHVAIIMDGNRRWAKARRLPVFEGHRRGERRMEPVIDEAIKMGIKYLTFWAFSTENWERDKKEVRFLMGLCRKVLEGKINNYHKKKVKLNVIGNVAMLPQDIRKLVNKLMDITKDNKTIIVNIALSYGGRDEIIRGIGKWSKSGMAEITEESFSKYLDTAGQPDPDLVIRTGGVMRLSGFLLWQINYAELYFTNVNWPDFSVDEFIKAVEDYKYRIRRFGK